MDLNNLGLVDVIKLLLAITALDFVCGVGLAISAGIFNINYIAVFLNSHILQRVIPVTALAGVGLGQLIVSQPQPIIWDIAVASGGAYLLETIASIKTNMDQAAAVKKLKAANVVNVAVQPPANSNTGGR
jgi:hypothetical protein